MLYLSDYIPALRYGAVIDATSNVDTSGSSVLSITSQMSVGDASKPISLTAYPTTVTAGARQGALAIAMSRTSAYKLTSWDGNPDCAIKVTNYNYGVSGTNGGTRGMDLTCRNRGGGTESWINGLYITCENSTDAGTIAQSTVAEFHMKNNYIVSTTHYGVLIQDDSQGVTVPTNFAMLKINTANYALTRANAIWIDSANAGFTNGVQFDGPITNALLFADTDGTNGATLKAGTYSGSGNTVAIRVMVGAVPYYLIGFATVS
jgi:hypothetical protein